MKTVKQLAAELNISKSTLHRLIQKNDIETIQDGNKRLIDEANEKAIKQLTLNKSLQAETICNDSESLQNRCKNESRNDVESIQNDYINSLKSQIETLTSQLNAKDNQIQQLHDNIISLTAEREQERKERQTILAELLELRQPKVIELKEPEVKTAAEQPKAPSPQRPRKIRQQPRSYSSSKPVSLLDTLKNLLKH